MNDRSRSSIPKRVAIVLGCVAAVLLFVPVAALGSGLFKNFYIPAESMAPTLLKSDRMVASMWGPGTLKRGDIVIFRLGNAFYVKRIAALPGDEIGMRAGLVSLNGQPVPQRFLRRETIDDGRPMPVRRLSEQFPGEARPHEIYDSGPNLLDEYGPVRVAPGHVFVLGDNRDFSADSRVPRVEMGVEQLAIAEIRGKALFYAWGPSRRTGEAITP